MAFRFADETFRFLFTSMIRIDGATGNLVWRYGSPGGWAGGGFSGWAVHHDGTIYFSEFSGTVMINGLSDTQIPRDAVASVVALDGEAGVARFRLPLPPSHFTHTRLSCTSQFPVATPDPEGAPSFGTPMVDENGVVHLEFLTTDHHWTQSRLEGFSPPDACHAASYEHSGQLNLASIQPSGALSWQTLKAIPPVLRPHPHGFPAHDSTIARLAEVIPDGQGGVLAAWLSVPFNQPLRVTRVSSAGLTEYPLPLGVPTVLGENGVAFASGGTSVMAFDVATGTTLWTWHAPNQPDGSFTFVHPVTVTAGNGLVVTTQNAGEFPFGVATVARIDAEGQATFDTWSATGIQYAYGDLWYAQGSLQALSAPGILYPSSVWPRVAQEGKRSARLPTLAHFIPVDPGVPVSPPAQRYTAEVARAEIQHENNVPRTVASHTFFLKPRATVDAFLSEVRRPIDALAFIGDSLVFQTQINGPFFSAGLCFFASGDGRNCLVRAPDPSVPELNYEGLMRPGDRRIDKIQSQVKVVFVASCFVGRAFTDLWDINESTPERALIVPANPSHATNLVAGTAAWIAIAENLAREGSTVQQAVDAANVVMGLQNLVSGGNS